MKPWLVRLGLALAVLGFAACSDSTANKTKTKMDTSVKPQEPPRPPALPATLPPKPSKTR